MDYRDEDGARVEEDDRPKPSGFCRSAPPRVSKTPPEADLLIEDHRGSGAPDFGRKANKTDVADLRQRNERLAYDGFVEPV